MTKTQSSVLAAVTMAMVAGTVGCDFQPVATGPTRHDPVRVELGNAERANVELDMGAGEMTIGGGAAPLLDGQFQYNVDSWKPLVTSSVNGSHATVTIKQPSGSHGTGGAHYAWNLHFNDKALLDMAINCGAGQAKLNLGTLTLRSLTVHVGVGQVELDLRGKPTHDYEVKIEGGIGQARIQLPQEVGVWAQGHGGIGSVSVTGLEKKGDHWENELYDKAKVNVKVTVNGGIGEIQIHQ